MYNNYWNQNHDMMFQNAVPIINSNYQYSPNVFMNVDPKFQMPMPRYDNERFQATTLLVDFAEEVTDLGDGFRIYTWKEESINPYGYFNVNMTSLHSTFPTSNMKVISGGWSLGVGKSAHVYAIESYPRDKNQWVITLFNNTMHTRKIKFFLTTKS
ncbi:hypothetical protein [Bacillus thuringiensis]|uniref:hypothetical protein n=1 Tax=Bacillus thuringiensis TaxID=1428 RepID=UPI001427BEB5|nr:hypothetical protein [Bacillus thuringiensis]NIL35003.1 hypothetical protein [Bacillus thuringiensis]